MLTFFFMYLLKVTDHVISKCLVSQARLIFFLCGHKKKKDQPGPQHYKVLVVGYCMGLLYAEWLAKMHVPFILLFMTVNSCACICCLVMPLNVKDDRNSLNHLPTNAM